MKLKEIQIDRFSVWSDLTLPIRSGGLSVVYGPNEAGKSTLMQFVRGILYGFNRRLGGKSFPEKQERMSGSLLIEEDGRTHRIHRAAVGALRGNPCLIGEEAARPAGELLDRLLHGIGERLFETAFSIELRELHELASLSNNEVAEHIYGASLGPAGRQVLEAGKRIDIARHKLIDPLQQSGHLVQLFERRDELSAQLRALESARIQHTDLCAHRDEIEENVAELRRRQTGIQSQLRGHLFLERAWGPWRRLQECERELDDLPEVAAFPEQGIERLNRLDAELADARGARDQILAEAKSLRGKLKETRNSEDIEAHAAAMQGFVQQQAWLAALNQRIALAQAAADDDGLAFEAARERLGSGQTESQLESLDTSAGVREKLFGTADSFRAAISRRVRIRRECRRLSAGCRTRQAAIQSRLNSLHADSIEAAHADTQRRIAELKRVAELELLESDLKRRLNDDCERLADAAAREDLPPWVYLVLGVFCFAGIVLAGWGLITGISTSWVAGGIYAMLALTCAGLAWGIRQHFEVNTAQRLAVLNARTEKWSGELQSTRKTLDALRGTGAARRSDDSAAPGLVIDQIQKQLALAAELEELSRQKSRLQVLRRRLRDRRRSLESAHREVGTARSNWGDLIHRLGMPESTTFADACTLWERIVSAQDSLRQWKQSEAAVSMLGAIRDDFLNRMTDLARRIGGNAPNQDDPLKLIEAWNNQLAARERTRGIRREIRRTIREKRREVAEYQAFVTDLEFRRNALLVQGGATTRDDFEQRARWVARRTFLEDQAADAQRDLELVSQAHADLAVVEEDLRAFNAEQNSRCIETLKQEAADLEDDVAEACEQLGTIKHSIDLLESDDEGARLRFEREQVDAQLRSAALDWCALEVSHRAQHDLKSHIERTQQPATLAAAAQILRQLTCGRYVNIWTPLGEHGLHIDDHSGQSLPLESLSRGTREQLLLAVRLAVVGDLAGKGIRLPLVLDDILVNFDESRTMAAVDLLLQWADQGQGHQILYFTCHPHLARLMESRGVEMIHLPEDRAALPRLAG